MSEKLSLQNIYSGLTPEDATQVAEAGEQIVKRAGDVARSFFEIGELLTVAHALINNGKRFDAWVKSQTGISRSYSYKLIAVVDKCKAAGIGKETKGAIRAFIDTLGMAEETRAALLEGARESGELRSEDVAEAKRLEAEDRDDGTERADPGDGMTGGPGEPILMRSEEEIAKAGLGALTSSKSDEQYTPLQICSASMKTLGHIDLDPASCFEANARLGATVIYTRKQDGLSKPWLENVFLNWPGGKDESGKSIAKKWSDKLLEEIDAGRTKNAIVILYKWMHSEAWLRQLLGRQPSICLLGTRTEFVQPGGATNDGMPHCSGVLLLSGDEKITDRFLLQFAELGHTVRGRDVVPWHDPIMNESMPKIDWTGSAVQS